MKLLHLLKRVSQMKVSSPMFCLRTISQDLQQIIKDCAAVVGGQNIGKTEAEKFKELMGETVSDKTRLGWAADSP